jgi:cytochrome c-type biogenesis protein CcmH/NrfG
VENRNILIGLGTGLVAGFMLGYGVATYLAPSGPKPPAPPATAPVGMGQDPDTQRQLAALARIQSNQAVVAQDPNNLEGWIQLANDYFDTHQPQRSVDAYARAIRLAPDNPRLPDLLTDQGIMYRELKQFDKALANFKQANTLRPDHLPSLLNLGVVYKEDLKDAARARKAWQHILDIAPDSPQAQQAKQFLAAS